MSWSLKLLRVNGIPIRIHFTFLLVVAWAVYIGFEDGGANWLQSVGFMVAFVLLLFLCVLLHELGHSLVAQLFGVKVVDITLLPIGGLARMTKMPDRPYQEFVMAAAGPATNIALAVALSLVAVAWLGPGKILSLALSSELLDSFLSDNGGQTLLALLILNNIFLAVFNLIPAFPLDGGRMLRSFLAALISHRRATSIASYVGQMLALVLGMVCALEQRLLPGPDRRFHLHGRVAGARASSPTNQPAGLARPPGDAAGRAAPASAANHRRGGGASGHFAPNHVSRARRRTARRASDPQRSAERAEQARPDGSRGTAHAPRDPSVCAGRPAGRGGRSPLAGQGAAIVVEAGQVIGTLSRPDLQRLTEALRAHPEVLPRE